MSATYRTSTYDQREKASDAMEAYKADAASNTTVVGAIPMLTGDAKAAYFAAYEAHNQATGAAQVAVREVETRHDELMSAFRFFMATLLDGEGHADTAAATELLDGARPSEVATMAYSKAHGRIDKLCQRLSSRTDLSYDADRASALQTANDAFGKAIATDDAAWRTKTACGTALSAAAQEFDAAYARLIHVAKANLSTTDFKAAFPRFVRKEKASTKAAVSGSAS